MFNSTRVVLGPLAGCVLWASSPLMAAELTLLQAQQTALDNDPSVRQFTLSAQALRERSVAQSQLPDPSLKLGANALPIDTFDLDQEPMTQLQVGVRQRFLPGRTLALQGARLRASAEALDHSALNQALQILQQVREEFVEVVYLTAADAILVQARAVFSELETIVREYYANGRAQQQDVYRAELERSRIDDRRVRIQQAEREARARLAVWLGDLAYRPVVASWPALSDPPDQATLESAIDNHPALRSIDERVRAAHTGVDIAREQYKPGWALDVTYGDRSGQDPTGMARSDFLFASVTIDLPVFPANRQDRELAASQLEADAQQEQHADVRRQLLRRTQRQWAALEELDRRLALFDSELLPQAALNSEASMASYQADVGDFTTLMRARLTQYELQLDQARAIADRLVAVARLHYIAGELP